MQARLPILFLLCLAGLFSLNACYSESVSNNPNRTEQENRNLWNEIRLTLEVSTECERPSVKKRMDWYIHHPGYLNQMAEHAKPYIYYIYQRVQDRDMPTLLVLLPAIESAYDPVAYSGVGAAGLWQFMPSTASGFGIKQNWWYDGRRDLIVSTRAALDYLSYLHSYFDDDWLLAIAAYDAGEGAVVQAVKHNKKRGHNTDYWSLSLPGETQHYIPRVLGLACAIKYADDYDLHLPYIPNSPYLVAVDVGKQIDLKQAAKMADLPLATIYHLNPGFNRFATDPTGPFRLLLPVEKATEFKAALAKNTFSISKQTMENSNTNKRLITATPSAIQVSSDTSALPNHEKHYFTVTANTASPANRLLHSVKTGESLWDIAKQYRVQIEDLQRWNKLGNSTVIHPKEKLLILR